MSIYSKLAQARKSFLHANVKKSGINTYAEFDYFELSDIVPVATDIFCDLNLVFITDFPEGRAEGTLIDTETGESFKVEFPYRSLENPAQLRMNTVQGLGSEITYMRRYLYYLILDIVEHDAMDATSGKPVEAKPTPAAKEPAKKKETKKPATQEQRTEIKKELTAADEQADKLQIDALKKACKALLDKDPDRNASVQKIALETKGFTVISKAKCAEIVGHIEEMLKQYGN